MKKVAFKYMALQINFLLITMKYSVVVSLCNMAAMQTLTLFASLKTTSKSSICGQIHLWCTIDESELSVISAWYSRLLQYGLSFCRGYTQRLEIYTLKPCAFHLSDNSLLNWLSVIAVVGCKVSLKSICLSSIPCCLNCCSGYLV